MEKNEKTHGFPEESFEEITDLPDEKTAYHLYRAIECLSERPGRFQEVMKPYVDCLTRLETFTTGLFDSVGDRQKRRDMLAEFIDSRIKDQSMRDEICKRISLAYYTYRKEGKNAR